MKTSVIVRQTKMFMSTGCNTMLTHYLEVDQMSKSTKNDPKTVIELINQINTWQKFEGP